MNELLPLDVQVRLATFMKAGQTGDLSLHIVNGSIASWTVTEHGRVLAIDKGVRAHSP